MYKQVAPVHKKDTTTLASISCANIENRCRYQYNYIVEFWKLLAVYIGSNTLSSLPWAIPFGEAEITTMRNQAAEILQWYDNMKNPVPTWYEEGKYDQQGRT